MKLLLTALPALILSGCFSTPPVEISNICDLLDRKVTWYQAVKASEAKYQSPKSVQLAIINQESHFASNAKPPRDKLFGAIPWTRPTSAYGFAQVVDDTWRWYQRDSGNSNAERNNFADAVDFVAWYMDKSSKISKIAKTDAYNQYLAYHEGHGGFNSKTHQGKKFLLSAAKQVEINAKRYRQQLSKCSKQLDSNRTWRFF
ncbi:MAG: transglycosylase SLT domain-containing protein [Candidatus Thioglobus sp.]|nr:transglycosylase SLT domain-containing protein [Candidatus Thioglobus sp.]